MHRVAYAIAWLASWPWAWRYYWRTRKLAEIERPLLPLLLNQSWLDDWWWREKLQSLDDQVKDFPDGAEG